MVIRLSQALRTRFAKLRQTRAKLSKNPRYRRQVIAIEIQMRALQTQIQRLENGGDS